MEGKVIFGYWNLRGFGHPIRFLLEYAGVNYDEVLYDLNGEEGRSKWAEDKFSLGMDFPNLPYLLDGDVKLTERVAILKYLARKFKPELVPEADDISGWGVCEMLESLMIEVWSNLVLYAYNHSEEIVEAYPDRVIPKLQQLSEFLGDRKFITGDNMKFVDFLLYELLYHLKTGTPAVLEGLANFPSYMENFEAISQIQSYMSSSKFLSGPCNSPNAKHHF